MKRYRTLPSPIGTLTLVENEKGELTHVLFEGDPAPKDSQENPTCAAEAGKQLNEYFAGRRKEFNLRLAPNGTEFQKSVWNALLEIPYGKTCSYGHIAGQLGKPNAMRAVGLANGSNPIPVIIPCHRVIGANGSLTGYGGGLPIKRHLLELEGVLEPVLL